MRQIFLFIFFFLVITSTVFPSNTKVSTVAAFNTALSIANPGDTITLANQTWQNAVINFSGKNGTAAFPIVLTGRNIWECYHYREVPTSGSGVIILLSMVSISKMR